MSVLIVHLRRDGVGPAEYARISEHVLTGTAPADGCLSRRLQQQGRTLLDVEVWQDMGEAGRAVRRPGQPIRKAVAWAPSPSTHDPVATRPASAPTGATSPSTAAPAQSATVATRCPLARSTVTSSAG